MGRRTLRRVGDHPGGGGEIGRQGEDAALRGYTRAGYVLVARNWRSRLGEIDLILARGTTLVICEVKARRGGRFGGPFDAVGDRKRGKLRALAEAFLVAESGSPRVANVTDVRFDVASVTIEAGGAHVYVFEDAF